MKNLQACTSGSLHKKRPIMKINYTQLNNSKKKDASGLLNFILLLVFSFFSLQGIQAQCGFASGLGCPGIDYNNYGMSSNNNASSIEYDNFVSSFHATVVREYDGGFKIWGQLHWEKDGSSSNLYFSKPTSISPSNSYFSNLTGVILKATIGSLDGYGAQLFILSTDGLWVIGHRESVLASGMTTGDKVLEKISLPSGISPLDVKSIFATTHSLAILTCTGNVYVISQESAMRGYVPSSGSTDNTTWYQVRTGTGTNASFLSNIIVLRGNPNSFVALDTNGNLWTWGVLTYLGDGNGPQQRGVAAQMTKPSGAIGSIKMIGSTGTDSNTATYDNSAAKTTYYILYDSGNLYALGENGYGELGNWSTTNSNTWVRPRYNSSSGPVMNNIHWISPNEHDFRFSFINVLTQDSTLVNWGGESGYDLGRGIESDAAVQTKVDPGTPASIANEKLLAVTSGGHTTMVLAICKETYGYAGHRIDGSMGDGTATISTEQDFTFNTATINACGAPTIPIINMDIHFSINDIPCNEQEITLEGLPGGGSFSIAGSTGGTANLVDNKLTFSGAGTVTLRYSISDPNYPCSIVEKDTVINFTNCSLLKINGTVWNDLNANAIKNSGEAGTNGDNGIWANLVDNNGIIIHSEPVNSNGTYQLNTLDYGTYSVQLSNRKIDEGLDINAIPALVMMLPNDWIYTGHNNGSACIVPTCQDPGIIPGITLNSSHKTINGIDFGIRKTRLTISKTSDGDDYKPGDEIEYTIVVQNSDNFDYTGVKLIDNLPEGTALVPGSVQVSVSKVIQAQNGSKTDNSPGTRSYLVPAGVDKLKVQVWGAGGKGSGRTTRGGGAGGGGGAYSESTVSVTPSTTYYYSVGNGTSSSNNGRDSWFSTSSNATGAIVLAMGGQALGNNITTGGTGGNASSGLGDIRWNGGNGANGASGSNGSAGGGGSSAGLLSNGNNGSGRTGGTAPNEGGDGGNGGRNEGNAGSSGETPGGGGGGARRGSSGSTISGGDGANGRVIISYDIPGTIGDTDDPPVIAEGWTIPAGETLTATFRVEVNSVIWPDLITNTATVETNEVTALLSNSVTNHIYRNTVQAVNDENTVWINSTATGNVTTNDFDFEGNTIGFNYFLRTNGNQMNSGSHISGADRNGNNVSNAGTLTYQSNGSYIFTPSNNFTGKVSIPYKICDNGSPQACDVATLDINILPYSTITNSVIANNDEYISYGNPVQGTVFSNDSDPQNDNFTVTHYLYDSDGDGNPDQSGVRGQSETVGGVNEKGEPVVNAGILILNQDGTFEFNPTAGFYGKVTVNYEITDNGIPNTAKDNANVVITVLKNEGGSRNLPPHAADDFAMTAVNVVITGNYFENDYDPDGNDIYMKDKFSNMVKINPQTLNPQTIKLVQTKEGGSVVFYSNGTYSFNPKEDFTGTDEVVYEVCDNSAYNPHQLCSRATLHLLVGEGVTPLAIDLLYFNAYRSGETVQLTWASAADQPINGYEIERSNDGKKWTVLDFVSYNSVAGSTPLKLSYEYRDEKPLSGKNLYRLRQIDLDQHYTYTDIRTVQFFGTNQNVVLYPNPTHDFVNIRGLEGNETIRVMDYRGRLIFTMKANSQIEKIDLSRFINGIYQVVIIDLNNNTRVFSVKKIN